MNLLNALDIEAAIANSDLFQSVRWIDAVCTGLRGHGNIEDDEEATELAKELSEIWDHLDPKSKATLRLLIKLAEG